MSNKIKLTIGEFSKLCFVTVKTLRHYEKIGLLLPHDVDEWTGYRYYDVSQMSEMAAIKRLKALGFSLEEIKEMLDDGLTEPDGTLIDQKIDESQKQLHEIRDRLLALQSLRNRAPTTNIMSKITIKPLPGGAMVSWRSHLKSYDELGGKLMSIVLPEMQRLGCVCKEEPTYCFTVDHNSHHNPEDIDIEYCERVENLAEDTDILQFKMLPVVEEAVCIYHHGDYGNFGESMAEALTFIEENGYAIQEEPRFCYIHGIWDCDSIEDWLTEIQIPVKKAN